MYPSEYYSLYPSFPRLNRIFVAMSFSEEFKFRWENVIKPAIEQIAVNNEKLEAQRVDARAVSDSILTEILTGISRSRLVIADITSIGKIDDRPVRNGNVLYEVGLAQAVRLPEEVLLFRSDDQQLLFDMSNIRVNSYDPDSNPEKAKKVVSDAIMATLSEIDLKKHLTVQRFAETLDYPSWWTLVTVGNNGIIHPKQDSISDIVGSSSQVRAINRLLEIGAIKSKFQKMTPEILANNADSKDSGLFIRYEITELGRAIVEYTANEFGILDFEMIEYFENNISSIMPKES